MSQEENPNRRDCERYPMDADIEFSVNTDVIDADTLDLSQTGISFETTAPLVVELKIHFEGEADTRKARLVWSKQMPGGKLRYGMKFIDE